MVSALNPTNDLDALTFRGSTILRTIGDEVTEATIDMSTQQASQLSISIEDPHYAILNRGLLNNGVYVDYYELRLQVAATETGPGQAGVGGVTVQIRPVAVQKLKARRGTLLMRNLSPSQFVQAECKAVGVPCVVQPSAKRNSISRDIPDKSNAGATSDPPSTWTTFNRLAGEVGFLLYEVAGTIYFGTPSWFAATAQRVYASWNYGDLKYRVNTPPVCRRSIDDSGVVTVTIEVPASRAAEFRPGKVLVLAGVPTFNGGYLIDSVNYSLMHMDQTITVQASTPTNLLTHFAVPITTNIAFPSSITQGTVANTLAPAVATITEPRRNTKSRSDFVYWVRDSAVDTYYVQDDKGATAVNTVGGLEGTDLINYALFQVGLSTYPDMPSILAACRARGKSVSVATALRTPGAILFAQNYMAVSTQIKNATIEPRDRLYVEVINLYSLSRFSEAWLLPGMVP